MSREIELLQQWCTEKEAYSAWGEHVSNEVQRSLTSLIAPKSINCFLKILPKPRLKGDQQLVEKAFYRKKKYLNPYDEITDKVGTRFVVLLNSDIEHVVQAVKEFSDWNIDQARDYEAEQAKNPFEFDYAAMHYVVRPKSELKVGAITIAVNTHCEIQIKTLLQHAYSELTHDTIYKPQIEATSLMRRNAAKAMALLEATNDYFEKVTDDVNRTLSNVREMTGRLSAFYEEVVGKAPKPTVLEGILLDAYEEINDDMYIDSVRELLKDKPFIAQRINSHIQQGNPIFNQPSIFLVYLSVIKSSRRAKDAWPFTPAEMEPLLNDLGDSNN